MIGRTLAHYRVTEKLGSGGMGEVYLAEDTDLGRRVALKVVPPELASDSGRLDRFRREARAVASLNHPNIVTLHSFEEADGIRFLVMELVEGKTLADSIPSRGVPLRRFFDLAIPLADALSAAHEQGVIHRDLKPGNVMVTDNGEPKILDFGLAKLRQDAETPVETRLSTEPLTEEGRVLGTIPYMSPEQLQGKTVDQRSDIFSFGILLYQLATGRRPFAGQSSADLVSSILRDTPRPVDELRGEMPHHLGRIIRHCLEKDPDRRLQSAKDLRNELEDLNREVTTQGTAVAKSTPRSRNWLLGLGTTGLLVVSVVAILTWLSSERDSTPALSPPVQQLLDQGYLWEQRGDTREALAEAEERFRRALELEPTNPLIKARLARVLVRAQIHDPKPGLIDEIRQLAGEALEKTPDLALARVVLGQLHLLEGEPVAAEREARRALEATPEEYAAHTLLGEALIQQDRIDPGLLELRRGVEMAGTDVRARLVLAGQLTRLGRTNEAAADYEAVLDYAPDHPSALNNLGVIYGRSGRYLEAIPLFKRLMELTPDAPAAYNLGVAYFNLERMEEAVEAFLEAYSMDPGQPQISQGLGEAYEKLGDSAKTEMWYERAVETYNHALEAGGSRSALLGLRAVCAAKLGHFDEALLGIRELTGSPSPSPAALFYAAQVHALAGDREETYRHIRLAVEAGYPRGEFSRDLSFRDFREDPEFLELLEAGT
jgi:serine/threonine protein kinase/lipopolysaccharide biosynthesis regulator YciM